MVPNNQKGFTLIELLVVVAIIGILAAIAIPQFATYREQAFCSRVESDVKNAMIAAEGYYVENAGYPQAVGDLSGQFTNSANVNLAFNAGPPFSISGDMTECTRGTYTYTQGSQPQWQ
jgi:type IV pilus assembly protein PilA